MKSEFNKGWPALVSGAVGMGTGLGLYSMLNSLFVIPLQEAFGWDRAEIAFSNVLNLSALLFLPFLGALVDKYDARRVALAGLFLLALSFVALSQQPGTLWLYYVTLLLMTFMGQATGPMIFTKVVNTWFHSSRGLALGLTMSGITLTSMLLAPVLTFIIGQWGWRWAFASWAMVPLIIGIPVVAWGLKPAPPGYLSSITEGAGDVDIQEGAVPMMEAIMSAKFWLLGGALLTANIAVGGMLFQLQPVLIGQGFSTAQAANLLVVFFAAVAIGRLSSGYLLDRFWPAAVAAVFLLLPLVGIVIFLSGAPAVFWIGLPAVLFLGLAQGAEVDFLAYLVPRYFGLGNYGKLFGILLVMLAAAMSTGGFLFGALFDHFGDYRIALMIAAVAYVCASVLILLSGIVGEDFDHAKAPDTA
ncbi:MAG: MFS transporter [Lysobacterales bacterium]|jgi:predicted MFS family arabinose efflux permease